MKLLVDSPQIFAKKITTPRYNDDEIYLAYYITLGKKDENGTTFIRKYLTKKISDIRYHVSNKTRWVPTNVMSNIEISDADAMFINIGLFEADDKGIYNEMKNKSDVLVTPEDFDWTSITIPESLTDPLSWAKSVWKVVRSSINYFRQDDLINTYSIAVPNLKDSDLSWCGLRELKMSGLGADYRVSFLVMPTE